MAPNDRIPEGEEILLLVRLSGDLTTKARKTRSRFSRRLAENAAEALRSHGIAFELDRQWSRFFVTARDPAALEVLTRVFGVHSVSAAERRTFADLDQLVRAGSVLFGPRVAGRRFAVRARRGQDPSRIPFRSADVERELGAALLSGSGGVDLGRPEVTAHVEVHPGAAYFFTGRADGPGGLPLGVEGRALALVSGGFDSAVAAWMMLKRGVALDYLFFNLGGAVHQQGALRVMKELADRWSYGDRPRLHAVDLRPAVAEIQERIRRRDWQVMLKRAMLRAAEALASELGLPAVVTGEAVGQVSSQTLQNLAVIDRAVGIPVLRPLLGFNKDEIVAAARRIGTYELSAAVGEYCAILPRYPTTHASLPGIADQEAALDPAWSQSALAGRRVFDLRRLDPAELASPELEIGEIPAGAAVLDLRSRAAWRSWRWPGAEHLDFLEALHRFPAFERGRTYVAYCEVGLKSAHLAERMREQGFAAYHVGGGVGALMQRAAEDPLHAALLAPAARD